MTDSIPPREGDPCPTCKTSTVVLCDCGQGNPAEHLICLACGEDVPECDCARSAALTAETMPADSDPDLRVGQLWRSRRRGESYRTLEITGLPVWDGEQHVHVRRNTSRRTQAVKETTRGAATNWRAMSEPRRFRLPRRRWVVESRPAMFPNYAWHRSLGPYFLERTAKGMLRRMRWFAPASLVALRVRDRGPA